jgi:hypothetical protein
MMPPLYRQMLLFLPIIKTKITHYIIFSVFFGIFRTVTTYVLLDKIVDYNKLALYSVLNVYRDYTDYFFVFSEESLLL